MVCMGCLLWVSCWLLLSLRISCMSVDLLGLCSCIDACWVWCSVWLYKCALCAVYRCVTSLLGGGGVFVCMRMHEMVWLLLCVSQLMGDRCTLWLGVVHFCRCSHGCRYVCVSYVCVGAGVDLLRIDDISGYLVRGAILGVGSGAPRAVLGLWVLFSIAVVHEIRIYTGVLTSLRTCGCWGVVVSLIVFMLACGVLLVWGW